MLFESTKKSLKLQFNYMIIKHRIFAAVLKSKYVRNLSVLWFTCYYIKRYLLFISVTIQNKDCGIFRHATPCSLKLSVHCLCLQGRQSSMIITVHNIKSLVIDGHKNLRVPSLDMRELKEKYIWVLLEQLMFGTASANLRKATIKFDTYVCVYVCMYVCMNICMYIWIYMYVCTCVCTYVCMYVHRNLP